MIKIVCLAIFLIKVYTQRCENLVTRPEIRELTPEQIKRYFSAIKSLNEGTKPTKYDNISNIHISNAQFTHGTSQFFVWHREYLNQFEKSLQEIDSSIILPYWDWTYDAYNPAESYVMSELMGGTGYIDDDYCLKNGIYSNWSVAYPYQHCLRRQYDEGEEMSSFYSTSAINSMIKNSYTYHQLREAIEPRVHGRVHVNIGGSIGDMSYMYSSNDPVFWLHHAFVDKIYYEWQKEHPDVAFSYDGENSDLSLANSTDMLLPFNITVKETLDTESNRYCYKYKRIAPLKRHKLKINSKNMRKSNNENIKTPNITTSITAPKDTPDDWLERNNFDPKKIKKKTDSFRNKHMIGNPLSKFWSIFS